MSRNPDYTFVPNDTEERMARAIAAFEQMTGQTLRPGAPERLLIAWVMSALSQAYAEINYAGNQNLPSRADGENLDGLGELYFSQTRPQGQAAICTEQFEISEAQLFDITIAKGTRVTDEGRALIWETVAEVTIPAGSTTATVGLRCQTVGTVGNGYVAGQLSTIVDVFPYYTACENTDTTDGGSDQATDDEYYELMRASMDAFSTAGPIGAYAYHAKSVSTEIADVKVVRPERTITATLTVYAGHAFLGGDNLEPSTLTVTGGTLTTDYTVIYADGLLTIALVEGGALASAETLSVSIKSVDAGCIDIYALMNDGSAASATIKALILAACNDKTVRPLTDKVSVKDPSTSTYNINVTYYTSEEQTTSPTEVTAAVNAAIEEYKAWQSARLGRDINPSKLSQYIMNTGVIKRVVVTSPSFTHLKDGSDHTAPQLAVAGTTTVTNGGVEDD